MSGRNLLNLISCRNNALNLFPRHFSSFNKNFGSQRTSLTKWYWLLTGSGVTIGYFAIKSFKTSSQVYALTPRKASAIETRKTGYHFNNKSYFQDELAEKAVKLTARGLT